MTNKDIKAVAFQYKYNEISKHEKYDLHTAKDVQKFVSSITGQQCSVGDIPRWGKFVINVVLENKDEKQLLALLKPFGIEYLKHED